MLLILHKQPLDSGCSSISEKRVLATVVESWRHCTLSKIYTQRLREPQAQNPSCNFLSFQNLKREEEVTKMRVSTCCCGCSLDTGCKIIAILGLIGGGGGIIMAFTKPELDIAAIVSNILGLVSSVGLLWGTLYDNFYSQSV